MDIKEFIKSFVNIEYMESSNCYGMFPFQMSVESEQGNSLVALATAGILNTCINAAQSLKGGFTKAFLALDYPANGDIETDFVAVFEFDDDSSSVIAIPYDAEGNVLEQIDSAEILVRIKAEVMGNIRRFMRED